MTEWDAMADWLESHGMVEWSAMVRDRGRDRGRKVYVLHEGDYSDRSLVGVFSSEARALQAGQGDDINECIIDDVLEWTFGQIYRALIDVETGEIIVNHPMDRPRPRHPTRVVTLEYGPPHDRWIEVWSPVSADHAVKVAVEKRQETLRARPAAPPTPPPGSPASTPPREP